MKKIILGFVAILSFTACNHDIETLTPQEKAVAEYSQSFIGKYGKPAPNQDWGFGVASNSRGATRSVNVNGNLWYKDWERPVNVTEAEINKVVAEFSKKRENVVNDISIDVPNYWVQQVWKGTTEYNDGFGQNIGVASNKMNKLIVYDSNYKEEVWWPEHKTIEGGYVHVNNFNNGNNTTTYTDDKTHQNYVGTTLMYDMATDGRTTQFGYHNSIDSKDHFEYIVLKIDGNWYVGFDFYATHPEGQDANKNMDVERDWVFNDWIVKIVPARPNNTYDARIICEDLGATDDFDFNDVVFDVKIDENKNKTYIKLLAAGGTIPLYIGDTDHEVHSLFGVDTSVMVNTFNSGEKTPVEFELNRAYESYNAIPVMINLNKATELGKGELTALKAEMGAAPQKILVETDYVWCGERQQIEKVYPKFTEWVKDKSIDWYKHF